MRLSRFLLLATGLIGSATVTHAQSTSRDWRPADRTVLGDFTRVTAVAASLERVFITSPSALLIWRPQERRWEGPFTPPNPRLLARVFGGLTDPLDNSLWLASQDGWVHYQPDIELWDSGIVPDGVRSIAFDADDPASGLFVRTGRGWEQLPRGGITTSPSSGPRRPVAPLTPSEVVRENPALQANAAQILTDRNLRTVRYTAAARSWDGRGWYLGTSGIGTLFLSDAAALPERLTFGLPPGRVGSVVSWVGGVWASNDRTAVSDASLTFVAGDLSDFRTVPGPSAVGTRFGQVRDLAGLGSVLFAATDAGVARVDTKSGDIRLTAESEGLPDARVLGVTARQGRVVAGTAHGAVRLNDASQGEARAVERVAPLFVGAVYGVLPIGDSVWLATGAGVLAALPTTRTAVRPASIASSPSLATPALALATLGDTLVAMGQDQLLWREPRGGRWSAGPSLSGLLGRLRAIVPEGAGLWIAGDRAVGYARVNAPAVLVLRDGDLPGAVNDLAVDDDFLWVATDRGLVRFRLDAIRP